MTVRHWPTTLLRRSIPKRSVLIWGPIYMGNLEKIWGSFLVATKLEFGLTFPRKSGVAWLLHYCVDQQPENLWNQDVWGRRFERAHRRIDFWMWATRRLHHFCWKWGFRYHQCTCRGDQQSRQEVSVFLQTSLIRSTIGFALIGAHLKVKFGEISEAVLVFAGSQDTPDSFFGDRGVACSGAGNSHSAQSPCLYTPSLLKVLLHCFCLFWACARCELYFFER